MNTELLILGSRDGTLEAFDGQNGSSRWRQRSGHPFSGAALARVADCVIAASLDGDLIAIAFADGAIRWEVRLPETLPIPTPLLGLRVVANEDRLVVQYGDHYFGVDPADGHVRWMSLSRRAVQGPWLLAVGQKHAYARQMEAPLPRQPAAAADAPQLTQPQRSPHAYTPPNFSTMALSTGDGTVTWGGRVQEAAAPPWDGATSVAEVDGVVYIYGHGLHAFDARSGQLLWSNDAVPYFDVAALVVMGAQIIVAAGAHLGAYRRDTGTLLWSETGQRQQGAESKFESFDGLLAFGDVVYTGRSNLTTRGFQIEARTPETGTIQWVWPVDATQLRYDISWRFCGAGDTLYVPALDTLWAIRASDGAQRWSRAHTWQSDAFLAISANDTDAVAPVATTP